MSRRESSYPTSYANSNAYPSQYSGRPYRDRDTVSRGDRRSRDNRDTANAREEQGINESECGFEWGQGIELALLGTFAALAWDFNRTHTRIHKEKQQKSQPQSGKERSEDGMSRGKLQGREGSGGDDGSKERDQGNNKSSGRRSAGRSVRRPKGKKSTSHEDDAYYRDQIDTGRRSRTRL